VGTTVSELSHVIKAYKGVQDVDIIHDHTLAGPFCPFRPPGTPVATTIHGLLTPAVAEIYRAASANTSIIAISHDQTSHAPDIPITKVIHHGMDLSSVPVGSGSGGYVCFVGRMCPDKGVMEAIDLARKAGMPLKIAAKMREAEELRYFRDVIKPLLGSNEEFVGEIGDADKYHLMGEAVAFLNPIQWSEPFGLVMIESLATGTPVVGTLIGSAPEIVEHGRTGYLASTEKLADLLPAAAGLDRAACRASVQERFSAERMVADHLDLFERLLEGKPAAAVPKPVALYQNR
jgi:glycosyltransferase involved in cell wall biosynthesis